MSAHPVKNNVFQRGNMFWIDFVDCAVAGSITITSYPLFFIRVSMNVLSLDIWESDQNTSKFLLKAISSKSLQSLESPEHRRNQSNT